MDLSDYLTMFHEQLSIQSWLHVCEVSVACSSRSASDHASQPTIPWHQGYVVLDTHEASLICYRDRKSAERMLGAHKICLRLDDGSDIECVQTEDTIRYSVTTPSTAADSYVTDSPDYLYTRSLYDQPYYESVGPAIMDVQPYYYCTLPAKPSTKPRPIQPVIDTSFDADSELDFAAESLDRRSWYYNRRQMAQSHGQGINQPQLEAPSLAIVDEPTTPQKFANFLSRHNPLKRTKSVSKLDRGGGKPSLKLDSTSHLRRGLGSQHNLAMPSTSAAAGINGGGGPAGDVLLPPANANPMLMNPMRASHSHESLLSYSTTSHMMALGGGEAELRALHPSVLSTPNCIQISTSSGATKYYQCRTPAERDRWMECLQRTMCPNRDEQRRTENSLQIWILEAKGVPAKRKYFCELCLDKVLYGRTSAKPRTDMCFWGEQFEFSHLKKVEMICINLYREADRRKKKDRCTLIGYVQIPVAQLMSRHPVERWYTVHTGASENRTSSWASRSSSQADAVSIRVKARFQSVHVLPLRVYHRLLNYVERNYMPICAAVEPALTARAKEDFVTGLIRVLHKRDAAKELLCDLVMAEVAGLENDNLMFRGNSLATKAMEAYQKLVADHYLQETLGEFVRSLLESDDDCEVDPLKLGDLRQLEAHRRQLLYQVEVAWGKIVNSAHQFPSELRAVFAELRQRLSLAGRQELADNLVSASIFLRFLCPAILSPSLFNLCTEYPSDKAARNLTLTAKTLQTLANFSKFSGKEHYMEFMNAFVEREWDNMRSFLKQLSNAHVGAGSRRSLYGGAIDSTAPIDLGRELAVLHDYLDDSLAAVAPNKLPELRHIIAQLSQARDDPDAALDLLLAADQQQQQQQPNRLQPHVTPLKLRQPVVQHAAVQHNAQRNSTIVQVSSPTSDYENNDVTPSEGQMPRFTAMTVGADAAQPLYTRAHYRRQPSAADVVSGRVPLSFADEPSSSGRGTGSNGAALDVSTEEDEASTPTQQHVDASSGYHSSQSGGSNSSSPVDRNAVVGTTASSSSGASATAAHQHALSIANPLYSSIQIGGGHNQHSVLNGTPSQQQQQQRMMCQSLPDVHQAVSLATPDTSFEADGHWYEPRLTGLQQQPINGRVKGIVAAKYQVPELSDAASTSSSSGLSPGSAPGQHRVTQSMTPSTLHTLLSPANSPPMDNSSSGASSASSTTSSNAGTAPRQQQPRTNPRYAVHRNTLTNGIPNGTGSSGSSLYKPLLLNTASVDSAGSSSGTTTYDTPTTCTTAYNPRMLMRRTNTCDVITRAQRPATITTGVQQQQQQPGMQNGTASYYQQSPATSAGNSNGSSAAAANRRSTAQAMARQAQAEVASRQQGRHTNGNGNGVVADFNETPDQITQRLMETERRLRDAEQRELQWRQKYEAEAPRWHDQIRPVMDRLQQLEHEMKQQVANSNHKQKMIEEQQRQIECLTSANARLNQLYTSRDSLEAATYTSPPEAPKNSNNNNNMVSLARKPSGILKNNAADNLSNNNNETSLMITPDQTPVHVTNSAKSTPIISRMPGDRTSVVVVEPVP